MNNSQNKTWSVFSAVSLGLTDGFAVLCERIRASIHGYEQS